MKPIDLGDHGYKHPDAPGVLWGLSHTEFYTYHPETHERIPLDPTKAVLVDTRPTFADVLEQIGNAESETWDEYLDFGLRTETKSQERWPDKYRWIAVYVVTGGSEGYYLHVDLIFNSEKHDAEHNRQMIFMGKSLCHDWEQCWASAARIAKALGA